MSDLELKGLKGLRNLNQLWNESSSDYPVNSLQYLPVNALMGGKFQPRKHMAEKALLELAASIKSQGILQPLIVRKTNAISSHLMTERTEICYEIVAGERRWRAAKLAGLSEVPVMIRDIDDGVALAFATIENIQRENLNPIEEAMAFLQLKNQFKMTHLEMAHMLGRSRVSITNTLRLLSLDETVQSVLKEGKIEMGHARALISLEPGKQVWIAQEVVKQSLTVRETEILVQSLKTSTEKKGKPGLEIDDLEIDDRCDDWSDLLSQKIRNKVSIQLNRQGKGKILIHVESVDEMDWLIEHLRVE